MTNKITADPAELMRQASMTAHNYFYAAIKTIDEKFGEGYAHSHPELLTAFMEVAARDFHTAITAQAIQESVADIVEAIRSQKG
jgi:hypothetical protein